MDKTKSKERMSKKALKLAGRRPMLLALIIVMTIFAFGLLVSGWLTPIPGRAQQNDTNSTSEDESPDCVASSTSTNCSEGSVVLSNVVVSPTNGCIGSAFSASVTQTINAGQVVIDTSYTNSNTNCTGNCSCSDTYTTNNPSPTVVSNWWTVSVGSFSTNGTGLSASFTPTDCGSGSITFNTAYQDVCDTNINTTSASGSFQVDAVTSLTTSAGLWVDDGDNDPNTDTYLVQVGCNSNITVTASDCLGLSSSNLPSCWTVNMNQPTGNATFIDLKTFSVDGNTVGSTTINVTCGTSTKTITIIVYKATFQAESDASESDARWGHAWWVLSVTPSLDTFLTQNEKTSQGTGGWYDSGDAQHHGMVVLGPQYIGSTTNTYMETGDYWWCISFDHYVHALLYVDDLANGQSIFDDCHNNCTTQTEQVAIAAFVTLSPISCDSCDCPLGLSHYLSGLPWPPSCSCQ